MKICVMSVECVDGGVVSGVSDGSVFFDVFLIEGVFVVV